MTSLLRKIATVPTTIKVRPQTTATSKTETEKDRQRAALEQQFRRDLAEFSRELA